MEETFSYSKLDLYQQCPFKYYLKYTLKNSIFIESIATSIGTLIHETEEAIAKSIVAGEIIDYIKLKNNIITKIYTLQVQFAKEYKELDKSNRTYYEKIYEYLTTGIYKLEEFMKAHPTYKIVGIEQAFNIEYNNKKFHGFIDRVFYDTATDHYLIQDIKTYAIEVEKAKLRTPLQFVIYALAVKELYNCTTDQISCEYYLPFCNLTQQAGTAGYLTRGAVKINKIFESIQNENYEPSPSPLCYFCEYCKNNPNAPEQGKHLCPYFCNWTREYKDFSTNSPWQGLSNYQNILENYLNKIKE